LPIHAGVDEAGYGPMLGPLVVGCAAMASDNSETELWNALADAVHLSPQNWDGLVVQDSKLLFRRNSGIRRLEEGCLAFVTSATGRRPQTLGQLLQSLSAPCLTEGYPWYDIAAALPLPLAAEPRRLDDLSAALSTATTSAGVGIALLQAELVFSGTLNHEVTNGKTKSDVVFSRVVGHLRKLLQSTEGEMFFTCDKLGGRNFYAGILQHALGGWVNIVAEGRKRSEYLMQLQGRPVHISFVRNGERAAPTVALASMFSKYLRELFIHLLNGYWRERIDGLTPTSGYVQDARRFIGDIGDHPDYHKHRPLLIRLK